MSPERWTRIKEVFGAALDAPAEARATLLEKACGNDESLRREVEHLLANEGKPSFESPLANMAGGDSEIAAGASLGRYRVEARLGKGGMGTVYRARDVRLQREVALKVLPGEGMANPGRRLRFEQEARAASALNHPNIVAIYDIGGAEGVDFIAMEYVPGKTLAQLIGRNGLALRDALKYAVQITRALAAAHGAGIVHRDLKPANIMVDDGGQVKVLDFGLAKLTERSAGEAQTMPETETGTIVGTVAYMSPEQAEGKKVDARSDIFSFGAVLYEMVTGHRAFQRGSTASTLLAILKEEPKRPGELNNDLPPDLEKILARCLRKDPERRFQHMSDLKVALEELKEETDSGRLGAAPSSDQKPVKRKRLQTIAWTAALLAVMAIAGLAIWFVQHATRQIPVTLLNSVPLTTYPGHERYPSLSPDGNQVAFSWNGEKEDNVDIYVKLIGPGAPLRLTSDPAPDTSPAWSPNGRFIAFVRLLPGAKARVFLVPALGGPERQLAETRLNSFPFLSAVFLAWSPDSSRLVVPEMSSPNEPQSLTLVSIDTGEKRRLTSPPARQFDLGPAFSSDGRTLAFLRAPEYAVNDLYLLDLSDKLAPRGDPRRLTFDKRWIASPVWTPDGREILFSSDRLGSGRRNLWRMKVSGPAGRREEPEPLASSGQEINSAAISRQGPQGPTSRLVYAQEYWHVSIWRIEVPLPAGAPKRSPLLVSTRCDWGPQFSPDGKKIAFGSDRSGTFEIWTSDRDGSNATQLTSFSGPDLGPVRWSPDGERLVFQGYLEGRADVFVMNANGSGLRRLTNDLPQVGPPSWSRDGRSIYFASSGQLWKMPANGSTAVQVTRNGGALGAESPDGKFVYYAKLTAPTSLWKVPVGGGEETQVLESLADTSTFAVRDEGIYFIPRSSPPTSVQLFSFGTGKVKQVATIEKSVSNGLSVSTAPDARSRWILYTQTEQAGSDLMLLENFR